MCVSFFNPACTGSSSKHKDRSRAYSGHKHNTGATPNTTNSTQYTGGMPYTGKSKTHGLVFSNFGKLTLILEQDHKRTPKNVYP